MTQTKHTQGPWDIKHSARGTFISNVNMARIADINEHGDNGSTSYANARLIAAAPELLGALEAALPELEAIYFEKNRASKTWVENEEANKLMFKIQAIRAAIAKAREQ